MPVILNKNQSFSWITCLFTNTTAKGIQELQSTVGVHRAAEAKGNAKDNLRNRRQPETIMLAHKD